MARFKMPSPSPYMKAIKDYTEKIRGRAARVGKRRLVIGLFLLTLLAGNSVFWIYRAAKSGINRDEGLGQELRQWEIDLNEDYLDAKKAQNQGISKEPEAEVKEEIPENKALENKIPEDSPKAEVPPEDGDKNNQTGEKTPEGPPQDAKGPPETPDAEGTAHVTVQGPQEIAAAKADEVLATMAMPVLGKVITEHSTDKLTYSKTLEQWCVHPGVDVESEKGSPVKAAIAGTVSEVRKADPKLGIVMVLDHGEGLCTLYGNLSSDKTAKKGDIVKKGQVIGAVGNTAPFEIEDPPHLHFEVLKDSISVDPLLYLPKLN